MNWSEFIRHNRWQKITAFLLAVLIWFTIHRRVRTGGGVRLTLDGSSRVFEGVPVQLLTPNGSVGRCDVVPPKIAVTAKGDPGLLNRLQLSQIHAFVTLEQRPERETLSGVEAFAAGFDLEVSPKEVLIRPVATVTNTP